MANQVLNIIFLIIMLSVAFSTIFAIVIKRSLDSEPTEPEENGKKETREKDPDEDYVSVKQEEEPETAGAAPGSG